MVLIGKVLDSEITCLIYKIKPESGLKNADTLNVFVALPLHVLRPNQYKIEIQVCGNNNVTVDGAPVFIIASLFTVQHTFLDLALGVVMNPEIINNNDVLKEESYLDVYNTDAEGQLINKNVAVLYSNQSGLVNSIPGLVMDTNYELGTYEKQQMFHHVPLPGGFILLDTDAKTGMSGSVVFYQDSVVGFVIVSSNTARGTSNTLAQSKCLATDMFYILPHINQCANAIHSFILNDPAKLKQLDNLTVMQSLENVLMPVVNHLGGSFTINLLTAMNQTRYLSLYNIQNFLNFPFFLAELDNGLSIPVGTVLNSNPDFINYFYLNQQNTEIRIINVNFKDKVLNTRVDIDIRTSKTANILDWSFRGDPTAPLEILFEARTVNNNGTVDLRTNPFTFHSSETTDVYFNKKYPRTIMQIPSMAFGRNIGLGIINSKYFTGGDLNFLKCNCDDDDE